MGVIVVYAGLLAALVGLVSIARPLRFLQIRTRLAGAAVLAAGFVVSAAGASLPAPLQRAAGPRMRLDDFVAAYQFHEVHTIRIHAPRDEVFRAIRKVTAGEIRFFRLLTWIRSPRLPWCERRENILAAPAEKPILDVATRSGFLRLAEEPGRELVVGTILGRRPFTGGHPDPQDFLAFNRPGHCKTAMNFRLEEEASGWTRLSTETRVFATDRSARRRFAAYWRVIYPGSTLIRRMWLDAIRRRAEGAR